MIYKKNIPLNVISPPHNSTATYLRVCQENKAHDKKIQINKKSCEKSMYASRIAC